MTPTVSEVEWLVDKTTDNYVLGDLNLDPKISVQRDKLSTICGQDKTSLLNEATTKNNNQLDHILGVQKDGVTVFTTSFMNFVSDHKSTTIRISLPGSGFVEDPRLPKTFAEEEEMDTE